MTDDEPDENESNEESEQPHIKKSRSVEVDDLSGEVEGGQEVTDVRDAPEEGYTMAPSQNNPDRNSDDENDDTNGEDSDN